MRPNIGHRVTPAPAPRQPASEHERRLRAVREALRANVTAAGFVADPTVLAALRRQRTRLRTSLRVILRWYADHTIT